MAVLFFLWAPEAIAALDIGSECFNRVEVGMPVSWHPSTDLYVRNYRIRLLPRVYGVKAFTGIRLSHTQQSVRHAVPALCPGRGRLLCVPLGQAPSLHLLRRPAVGPALFGGFIGTMGLSDFPCACTPDVRCVACSGRPADSSSAGTHGISRFSCMKCPRMRRVFDSVGPVPRLAFATRIVWPSPTVNQVGTPDW